MFLIVRFIFYFGFLLLYAPLILLVVGSFTDSPHMLFVREYNNHWTLNWYLKLLENRLIWNALWTSVCVGFWSMCGSTLLGTTAALALKKKNFPSKTLLNTCTYIPFIMPEIVLGLSLLIWFIFLNITLGTTSIILAHITFSVSYVIMTVKSRLHEFDLSLEEAAKDLGASNWKIFTKITLPLIQPGVLSGAVMAFTLSFDDFLITFFTAGVGSDTLPLKIYSMIKFGVTPEVNALSTILLAMTLLLVFIFFQPFRSRI